MFHITSREEWDAAVPAGEYLPSAFADEGFIHCSYGRQVEATAARHFAGRTGLVLLEINREALRVRVVDENLNGGGEVYPHIYGPLPVSAVVAIHTFTGSLPS
jgi:uncharacterized protein (DUF952 family)